MTKRSPKRAVPVVLALLLAACGGGTPASEPGTSTEGSGPASPSAAAPNVVLFALGDSIPFNLEDDCPGCTGFVNSYGAHLQDQLGEPVAVINESRHDSATTSDIVEQLQTDQAFLDELATADVVVMSVGFNDQPPFLEAHDGCPEPIGDASPLSTVFERAAATSRECIDSVVQVTRDRIAEVFAGIREQAPNAPIAALTAYDTWVGWSELDSTDAQTRDQLLAAENYWFHQWRDAMCEEAAVVDATCIDVYTAFNGADGTQPAGDFVGADYTHPNQHGNDVIRELLIEANLPLPPG